jgi:serine protease AprX
MGAAIAVLLALLLVSAYLAGFIRIPGTLEPSEWAFEMVQIRDLNAGGLRGAGVTVCVVDTGIDQGHPDLARAAVVAWRDFVNGQPAPYDDDGHGTGMAGLIAADGRVTGGAWNVELYIAKAIAAGGTGTDSNVASAIRFCLDPNGDGNRGDRADVISLSLGGGAHPIFGSAVADAANEAIALGVFVVAAAGNDGEDDDGEVEVPAREPLVIAVGAVDREGRIASFSSRGRQTVGFPFGIPREDPNKKPEVVAPGVDLIVPWIRGEYARVSGTSPATAIVAGGLALVLEAHPEVRKVDAAAVEKVKTSMMRAALPLPGQSTPHDNQYGYGLFQAADTDEDQAGATSVLGIDGTGFGRVRDGSEQTSNPTLLLGLARGLIDEDTTRRPLVAIQAKGWAPGSFHHPKGQKGTAGEDGADVDPHPMV